jgi:hypothetical protein
MRPSYLDVCQALACYVKQKQLKEEAAQKGKPAPNFVARFVIACGEGKIFEELQRQDPRTMKTRVWHPLLDQYGELEKNLLHLYLLPSVPFWKVAPILNDYENVRLKTLNMCDRPFNNWDRFFNMLIYHLRPHVMDAHIMYMYQEAQGVARIVMKDLYPPTNNSRYQMHVEAMAETRLFLLTAARLRLRLVSEAKIYHLYGSAQLELELMQRDHLQRLQTRSFDFRTRHDAFTWRYTSDSLSNEVLDETEQWICVFGHFRNGKNQRAIKKLLLSQLKEGVNAACMNPIGEVFPQSCYALKTIKWARKKLTFDNMEDDE